MAADSTVLATTANRRAAVPEADDAATGPAVLVKLGPMQPDPTDWLSRSARDPFLYLTTIGRRSAQPHRIEIWFAAYHGKLYLLSGGRDRSDWLRNLQVNARVNVELAGENHAGVARVLEPGTGEDLLARELLVGKYEPVEHDSLEEWGRTSLPVVIEFD
jgi:deazaflavin-dependent oxidoreductase (nitroreductase family)